MRRMLCTPLCALLACGSVNDPGDEPGDGGDGEPFAPETETIDIEIDYQDGAEPFTSFRARPGSPFTIFRTNVERIFENATAEEFLIPETLDEMEGIGPASLTDFTVDDLMQLAADHRDSSDTDTVKSYYIVFVDGYYQDGGERKSQVLGVSLGDTGVIAMFKPVIESTSVVDRFVEQATLVHELGHAVGLVNNGVALTSEHHDAEHGAHCTNEDCVMYFAVEGASDAAEFVMKLVNGGDTVLFGEECLSDLDAAGSD